MSKRFIDLILITITAFIAFEIAVYRVIVYENPNRGDDLMIYTISFTLFAFLAYAILLFRKNVYRKYRWWRIGLICGMLLLLGVLTGLGVMS